MKVAAFCVLLEDAKYLLNTMFSKILSKKENTSNISAIWMRALLTERITLQESNKTEVSKYPLDVAVPEVPVGQEVYGTISEGNGHVSESIF